MADPGPTESAVPPQGPAEPDVAEPLTASPTSAWERIKEHKILQWGLGYFGAALALAHSTELLSHTYHWPEIVQRIILGMLIVGLPLALTLAWYHGHKGLKGVGQGELMIASILVVIGAGLLIVLARAPGEHAEAEGAVPLADSATSTAAPRTSIAVLPFSNLTGDPTKEYLGDGMAEELINKLSRVPGLRIPARTSTFSYKGRNLDARQIAKDLQVGTLLEGSVRSAGKTLRISVQLSDAQSDSILWSHDYDRDFTDLFTLQDEVARAIVQALQVNLKGASVASVSDAQAPPTQDIEAYTLYLRSKQVGHVPTERSLRESVDLLEQAVERDPNFARAYASLALRRISIRDIGIPEPNALEDAERDAARALALDPKLASAQAILGVVQATRGDWLEADTSFRAAMAQDPGDAEIIDQYCLYLLLATGHLRQALTEIGRARRLAPAELFAVGLSMAFNSITGHDTETQKFVDLAIALGWTSEARPMQVALSGLAQRKGQYAEAADHILSIAPASLRAAGGDEVIRAVYAAFGDPAQRPAAAKALKELLPRINTDEMPLYMQVDASLLFTQLDDLDSAFEFANRNYNLRARAGGSAWSSLWTPAMRPFRRDPRFQPFVTRLKLMDYWQKHGPPDDCELKDGKLSCH